MALCSDQMRKYYWGVVLPHAKEALLYAGWEIEEIGTNDLTHGFFKSLLHIQSIADLPNKQFSNYIENIIRICAVYLHYTIPDANS